MLSNLRTTLAFQRLPQQVRESIVRARYHSLKRIDAARGESRLWRDQVAREESTYMRTLIAQVTRENL